MFVAALEIATLYTFNQSLQSLHFLLYLLYTSAYHVYCLKVGFCVSLSFFVYKDIPILYTIISFTTIAQS